MTAGFNIRRAVPSDAPAIAALETEIFSDPWSEAGVLSEINQENALFLVCEIGKTPAGYVSMETVCGECYIANLAVKREYRRQGIAKALLRAIINAAKEERCTFLTLEARASNAAARTLYEKAGFAAQGVRPGFYSSPDEDAVIYTLFL